MKFLVLVLFTSLFYAVNSQSNFFATNLYKLDSIYDSKIKVDFQDFSESEYNLSIFKDNLFIYCPSYTEDDTIRIKKIDLNSYNISDVAFHLNDMSNKIKTPYLKSMDFSIKYSAFYFTHENLIIYDNLNKVKLIDTVIGEIGYCPFENIKIIEDRIFFYKTYNTYKGCGSNILIKVFNIEKRLFEKEVKIENVDKEFSHFKPNQLISISKGNNIAVSRSTEYKIYIYNQSLDLIDSIFNKDSSWRSIPKGVVSNLNKLTKNQPAKSIIEYLRPYNDKYSRIERVNFLTDTSLLVVKIPYEQKLKNYPRFYDIFIYSPIQKKWILKYKNIYENPDNKGVITKENLAMQTSNSLNVLFTDKYFVNFKASSIKRYYGKTNLELEQESEKNGDKEITYKIFVYKLK